MLKVIAHSDDTPLKEKVLIADDSISAKTGKEIELVSYHYDHKVGRWILGNCYLQLGYHNGINFYPVDVTLPKTGDVRLLFVSYSRKEWRFLYGP